MDMDYLRDIDYLKKLELFSACFSVVTMYFGMKQRIISWPISITISLLNLPIYYSKRAYASFLHGIIYISISLYGWYCWRYGGKNRTALKVITRTSLKEAFLLLLGVLLYMVTIYPLLMRLQSNEPFLDASRNALTLVGMWATSHKKLETYIIWFTANAVSICFFQKTKTLFFMAKYTFYLIFSVYSYYVWYQQYQAQKQEHKR